MTESQLEPRTPARMTPVAWQASEEMSFDDWREAGKRLGMLGRAAQWWIGDWVNFGAGRYGEKYEEALEVTGYSLGSLRDMAWVAATFEVSRRRDILSWGHHREVAPLDPPEQDEILAQAAEQGWSQKKLRGALKRPPSPPAPTPPDTTSTATESLLIELTHPGEPEVVAAGIDAVCAAAEAAGFRVLDRPA